MAKLFKICFVYILLTIFFTHYYSEAFAKTKSKPEKGYEVYYEYSESNISPKVVLSKLGMLEKKLTQTKDTGKKAELLFSIAKCKIYLGYEYKKTNFVRKHSSEYFYSEPGDIYTYNGNDLKIILAKYPKTLIADEAAYMMATLPTPGECEGDVSCSIARELSGFEPFFKKFPTSPYISNAISDMNDSFKFFLEDKGYSFYDDEQKNSFNSYLNTYLDLLLNINNECSAIGLLQTAKAYIKIDNKLKAKEALHCIIAKYPKFSQINETKTLLNTL